MRRVLLVALGLAVGLTSVAEAQYRDNRDRGRDRDRDRGAIAERWEELGCVDVGRRPDLDVLTVGRREGSFAAIRLAVSGNDVEINDLKVIYGDGEPDNIRVRSQFREGSTSRDIDLKGAQRRIDRIEIVSRRDFRGRGRGRAKICVSGLAIAERRELRPAPGRKAEWVQLGCQKVGFLRDRDSIQVGRREGRFSAIRLEVSRNDIHVNDLVVVYANGEPDRLPVRSKIREGGQSGPLDLKGRERSISRIDMNYRTRIGFGGSAMVCVSGLQYFR